MMTIFGNSNGFVVSRPVAPSYAADSTTDSGMDTPLSVASPSMRHPFFYAHFRAINFFRLVFKFRMLILHIIWTRFC
jgi:hypothetical protein